MQTVQTLLEKKGNDVGTIDRNANVADAAILMSKHKYGALVVTDDQRVIGIFTERDILTKVVARKADPETTKISQVMTSPMTCCRRDTPMSECRSVMSEKGIRHLPVVEDGELHGLISARDLLSADVAAKQDTISTLERTIDELYEYLYTRT